MAMTVYLKVVAGHRLGYVNVVCGGSTRKQPRPSRCTQYHQLLKLSFDAFHASEMLFGPEAVMRKLVGAVGGVRSRPAEAAAT